MTALVLSTTKLLTTTVPVPVAVPKKSYSTTKPMLAMPVVMGRWETGLCLELEV